MADERPNILILVCHDLGRHLGCYGQNTVNSPRVDRFAAEGVKFTNAFCVAPQCSPSRAALFTGRYPHSNGCMGLCHNPWGWDLYRDERHLSRLLADAGYRTALAGIQHETRRPREVGWQTIAPARSGRAQDVTDAAIATLDDLVKQPGPFYLQAGYFEPHRAGSFGYGHGPDSSRGVRVPDYLQPEDSAREDLACYQGAIAALDAQFGRMLDHLDQLGVADNTLVLFTTDHGIPYPRAKCAVTEAGLEICQILRWPKGRVSAYDTLRSTAAGTGGSSRRSCGGP